MTLAEEKLKLIKTISEMEDEAVLGGLEVFIDHTFSIFGEQVKDLPPLEVYSVEIGEQTDVGALAKAQYHDPLTLRGFAGFRELDDNHGETL